MSRKVSSIPCKSVVCVEGECVGRLCTVKSKERLQVYPVSRSKGSIR